MIITLFSLTMVLVAMAAAGLFYVYQQISTPPIDDPARPLLSWRMPVETQRAGTAPWLRAAQRHRTASINLEEFRDPALRFGPWTRWWWPGNLVDQTELVRELTLFADVGIAGVEIQPFAISVTPADMSSSRWQQHGWDSPEFYANLTHVMTAADTTGLGVDLNNGSGWPTGGPHVALEDGLRQLLHGEAVVTGPGMQDITLPEPAMPMTTLVAGFVGIAVDAPMQTFAADKRELVAVTAARIIDNARTVTPWDFLDQIVLDPESAVDITAQVEGDRLRWDAPGGEWVITALWELPGGELISGGYAHPHAGYVVDHLDAARMRANQDYLFRPETGLRQFAGRPLRAFFNDSLEFRQERHYARKQLELFKERFGYDPTPLLPALLEPGKDQMPFHALNIPTAPAYDLGEAGRRFVEDWETHTSDLFRERYLKTMREWGAENHLAHRLQAYGGPIDIISAAGESDIPEAEQLYAGGSETFLKAVASGAQIADKPIVSAESFVFVGRAFMTTPLKIKALADKAFVSGINQLVYHGTAYQIENAQEHGYPAEHGWFPWQLGLISTDFSEHWRFWEHAPTLNRYIARHQYLLRKGDLEADVVFLYPGLGFPQGYGNSEEPFDQGFFAGEEALQPDAEPPQLRRTAQQMRAIWHEARRLEQQGLTWAWINEESLASASVKDGVLHVGKLQARSLKLHDIEILKPASAEKIAALSWQGLPVEVSGKQPIRQPGLVDWQNGDHRVRNAVSEIVPSALTPPGPIAYADPNVRSLRRRLDNGEFLQLFSNPTAAAIDLMITTQRDHSDNAVVLDPWNAAVETLLLASDNTARIHIPAYGTRYVWLTDDVVTTPVPRKFSVKHTRQLEGWSLSVANQTVQSQGALPGNWRLHPTLRDSAGPGIYRAKFDIGTDEYSRVQKNGSRLQLRLEAIQGAASVAVNSTVVGHMLVPPFAIDLQPAIQTGTNEIVITLTIPRKNSLISVITEGQAGWNSPDLIGTAAGVSVGLFGPAELVELVPLAVGE